MSDIVERLRKTDPLSLSATLNTHDAIAEIERLRDALTDYHRVKALGRADAAENERWRAALTEILSYGGAPASIALRALEKKP